MEKHPVMGPDGLYDKLIPSAKPCAFGERGEFPRQGLKTKCAGKVAHEGQRMDICSAHRLAMAVGSAESLAKAAEDTARKQQANAVRMARLQAILLTEVK